MVIIESRKPERCMPANVKFNYLPNIISIYFKYFSLNPQLLIAMDLFPTLDVDHGKQAVKCCQLSFILAIILNHEILLKSRTYIARHPDSELHRRKENFRNLLERFRATASVYYSLHQETIKSVITATNELNN